MKADFKAAPLKPANGQSWAFVVLPNAVSEKLARRGRITVIAAINGYTFEVLLEPDGKKSHWLRIDKEQLELSGAAIGIDAQFEVVAADIEPEPQLPTDFAKALQASSEAHDTWHATTTIARLDWIHWITSAKQQKTRTKRINDACNMLASGKKRVCCFDSSGFYSKAFSAPQAAQAED